MLMESRRVLFLAAHPDDETLVAGTMYLLRQQGTEIHVAWVTDTDAFGGLDRRHAESRQAMAALGVPPERYRFMNLPTLDLVLSLEEGVQATLRLLEEVRPDLVVTVGFEGGHVDHDAVNFLAWEALRRLGWPARLLEFPLYNCSRPWFQWWPVINRFPHGTDPWFHVRLTPEAADFKYSMVRLYESQARILFPIFLVAHRSRMLAVGEPLREVPRDRDHSVPPHGGCLAVDRWFNRFMKHRFAVFAGEVRRLRQVPLPAAV